MNIWNEHFDELLNPEQTRAMNVIENKEQVENEEIKIEKIIETIKMLKLGKMAGHDGITSGMVKNLGGRSIEIWKVLFKGRQ